MHPFRKHFEELAIGDSLLTHRRTVSEADIVAFGGISGDFFYMHFDEIAAKESPFGKRIAHGYFVLSAAAGLFVSPAPGPVLANYGLDTLRFVKPVGIGDTIRARLTCKRKIDRNKKDANGGGQGVVAWDVEVTNQDDELVASYDILTLVAKRERLSGSRRRTGKPLRGDRRRLLESPSLAPGTPMATTRRAGAPKPATAARAGPAHPQEVSEPAPLRHRGLELHHARRRQGRWCCRASTSRSATPRPATT